MGMTFQIFKDVMKNKNVLTYFFYMILAKGACSISSNVSEVYLTNDLGFAKESLSIIQVICTPLNIIFAGLSGYLSN